MSRENVLGVYDDEVVDNKFVLLEMSLEDELEEVGDEVVVELRKR